MTVSLAIPTYNGKKFLTENLPQITQLPLQQIIIVDDASTDDTVEFVKYNFPQIKLITHLKNQRFPITANDCIKNADSDIIILLNQDAIPVLDINHLLSHFSQDPNLFAVTFNDTHNSYAQGKYKNGFIEFNNGKQTKDIHPSLWASGGASAFRKSIWSKLGGFDPIFTPGYFEDFDLGLRAWHAGYKIIWCKNCHVIHDHPSSTFTKFFSQTSLSDFQYRNYLLAHWKNLKLKNLVTHFFFLISNTLLHPRSLTTIIKAFYKILQTQTSPRFDPKQLLSKIDSSSTE